MSTEWKLPSEQEARKAFWDCYPDTGDGTKCDLWMAAFRWCRAMLAASPQPEPGLLTDERAIALWGPRSDGPSNREIVSFARAIEREVLSTTRKRTAEENARIMGLVGRRVSATVNAACLQEREPSVENQNEYWVARRSLIAEVERLLGGEA